MFSGFCIRSEQSPRRHPPTMRQSLVARFSQLACPLPSPPPCPGDLFAPSDFASLRMWRQAATAFDKAKADGLPVTSTTYTFAINAMSKGGRCVPVLGLERALCVTSVRKQ